MEKKKRRQKHSTQLDSVGPSLKVAILTYPRNWMKEDRSKYLN